MEENKEISVGTARNFVELHERLDELKRVKHQYVCDDMTLGFSYRWDTDIPPHTFHVSEETKNMIIGDIDHEIERLENEINGFEWHPVSELSF